MLKKKGRTLKENWFALFFLYIFFYSMDISDVHKHMDCPDAVQVQYLVHAKV